jgi:hypothetical protein
VFFDAPYNELKCNWEYQITEDILVRILKQIQAVHLGDWQICAIMHKPTDTPIVMSALEKQGYCQMNQFYWYKGKEHQTKTPVSSYTSSVEIGTIGFLPDRSKCKWFMGTDPRKRQNHFEFKGVTKYYKYDNGEIVNPCQKPPELLRWLCGNHLSVGSTVLVLGSGSGADVIGATQSCCNVVTVERDQKQFDRLQTTLVKYASLNEAVQQEAETDEKEGSSATGEANVEGADDASGEEEDTPPSSVCPECTGKLVHDEDSVRILCSQCVAPAPLHKNCAREMPDGTWLCLTCFEKIQDAEEVSQAEEGEK